MFFIFCSYSENINAMQNTRKRNRSDCTWQNKKCSRARQSLSLELSLREVVRGFYEKRLLENDQNEKIALEELQKQIESTDDPRLIFYASVMFFYGIGFEKDLSESLQYCKKAVRMGYSGADSFLHDVIFPESIKFLLEEYKKPKTAQLEVGIDTNDLNDFLGKEREMPEHIHDQMYS
ncbi:hypothetical protein K9M16_03735 [Candidatus Babeliales bacterium]|nr:hypothetical protein [Candidatus Babeliales bacterium]